MTPKPAPAPTCRPQHLNLVAGRTYHDHNFWSQEAILMDIPAALFKAECLKLMDQVEKTREPIIITKHGRPVAQLAPVPTSPRSLFGYMKGTVRAEGDIMSPVEDEWSALSGDEDDLYERPSAKRTRRKR